MRRPRKSTFRPAFETAEARLLTTGGIAAHVVPHPASAPAHTVVSAEAHHPRPSAHHPAKAAHHPQAAPPTRPVGCHNASTFGSPSAPIVAEAWIKLVNTTGSAISYRISLAPYDGGKFLDFTIPSGYPNPTQYQYAGLTATGPGSVANFQIQFSGQSPASLATGPSQAAAQGYYIFVGSNGLPYVSPIIA